MTIDKFDNVWADSGETGTAPTTTKQDTGFVRREKPKRQLINWLFNQLQTTVNSLADYVNAGISLTDLVDGDTDVEDSSIKINDTGNSITTTLDGNYLKVSKDDNSKQTYVKDSGLTVVDTDFSSSISNDKPVRIDISSASWILSTDVYISSINTSLFRPFSVYSPPYLGSVMGYSGSDLIIIPLDMFTIRDTTGTAYLYDIQIRDVGVDPNTITSMALYLRLS